MKKNYALLVYKIDSDYTIVYEGEIDEAEKIYNSLEDETIQFIKVNKDIYNEAKLDINELYSMLDREFELRG